MARNRKKKPPTEICEVMCATCPFRAGSKYRFLRDELALSALAMSGSEFNNGSRICHSTGVSVFYGRTGKREMLCRGARDLQLQFFHGIGFLEEATDAAWAAKLKEVMKT